MSNPPSNFDVPGPAGSGKRNILNENQNDNLDLLVQAAAYLEAQDNAAQDNNNEDTWSILGEPSSTPAPANTPLDDPLEMPDEAFIQPQAEAQHPQAVRDAFADRPAEEWLMHKNPNFRNDNPPDIREARLINPPFEEHHRQRIFRNALTPVSRKTIAIIVKLSMWLAAAYRVRMVNSKVPRATADGVLIAYGPPRPPLRDYSLEAAASRCLSSFFAAVLQARLRYLFFEHDLTITSHMYMFDFDQVVRLQMQPQLTQIMDIMDTRNLYNLKSPGVNKERLSEVGSDLFERALRFNRKTETEMMSMSRDRVLIALTRLSRQEPGLTHENNWLLARNLPLIPDRREDPKNLIERNTEKLAHGRIDLDKMWTTTMSDVPFARELDYRNFFGSADPRIPRDIVDRDWWNRMAELFPISPPYDLSRKDGDPIKEARIADPDRGPHLDLPDGFRSKISRRTEGPYGI